MKKFLCGLVIGASLLLGGPSWADTILTPDVGQTGTLDTNEKRYDFRADDRLFVYDESSNTNVGFYIQASTGNVLIGQVGYDSRPDPDAVLELSSVSRGFLPPRMNAAQRNTLDGNLGAADRGMVIFNLTNSQWQGWNGSVWENFTRGNS